MITIITIRCMTIDPTSVIFINRAHVLLISLQRRTFPAVRLINKNHVSTCIKVYNLVEKLTISKEQTKSLNNFLKLHTFH